MLGDVDITQRVSKACDELIQALCAFWINGGFHDGGDDFDDFEAVRSAIAVLIHPLSATGMYGDLPTDLNAYFAEDDDDLEEDERGYPLHEFCSDVPRVKQAWRILIAREMNSRNFFTI